MTKAELVNNYTKNTAIVTEQLLLFAPPSGCERLEKFSCVEEDKPFALQIRYIPDFDRSYANKFCRLIHYESQLEIPGQYTHPQAEEILRITRHWDWGLNSLGIPRCWDRLLLLDKFSNKGGEADA